MIFCHLSLFFFFSSRRRHTRCSRDWSSDVCSSDLDNINGPQFGSNGVFLTVIAGTEDVTIEHNTVIHTGNIISTRSEEHTSELSHGYISYAVFCLKKKKNNIATTSMEAIRHTFCYM